MVDFYRIFRFVALGVKVRLDPQISRISWVSVQLGSKGIDLSLKYGSKFETVLATVFYK